MPAATSAGQTIDDNLLAVLCFSRYCNSQRFPGPGPGDRKERTFKLRLYPTEIEAVSYCD